MAVHTGPVCKLCRREGVKLFLKGERCFTPKCAVDPSRRPYPPGEAGRNRRRKASDYGIQLREKQKAKVVYGILERQFRRHFASAERRTGQTGENLLQILELRLDNIVYRLGFADSRHQARQLVNHGHFVVNGRKVDVPSAQVRPGDTIAVASRSRKLEYFKTLAEYLKRRSVPAWLSLDPEQMSGKVLTAPTRADIDASFQEQLVVEFYSR